MLTKANKTSDQTVSTPKLLKNHGIRKLRNRKHTGKTRRKTLKSNLKAKKRERNINQKKTSKLVSVSVLVLVAVPISV